MSWSTNKKIYQSRSMPAVGLNCEYFGLYNILVCPGQQSRCFVTLFCPVPVPMSTHPVLLGRVTGLNAGDTPKAEGQASQPCHVDIETSPSPTVTRVTHGDSEDGPPGMTCYEIFRITPPSWNWRFFQLALACLVAYFTNWLAMAPLFSEESWDSPSWVYDDKRYQQITKEGWKNDPSQYALQVSTFIAGLAAMWLFLIAPTAHTLLAARFLCLNWVEGLVTLRFFAAAKGYQIRHGTSEESLFVFLAVLRWFLLLCEFLGLQFLIQNRLQSLWPALNQPRWKLWLDRCLGMEAASLFLGIPSLFLAPWFAHMSSVSNIWSLVVTVMFRLTIFSVPSFFLIWIVLVAVTLYRVVLMFQKASKVVERQGLFAVHDTFQACRTRSILQFTGVIISLATSFMIALAVIQFLNSPVAFQVSEQSALFTPLHDTIVPQCIDLLVNVLGIILLSGASGLITSKGTLRFPPLRCCPCHCRPFRRCRGFKSLCRSKLKICEENDWEKKTRELANRGISLEELLAFYKKLGDTVMESFQPSVHTTTDVVRLAIIPMTASSCSSYAQLVNKGEKVLPKKMVTHNWSNLFRDLAASVIADTLGEHTFEFIAELLSDKAGVEALEKMLQVHGSLEETYWICAFAVNQHAGICGANPAGTVDPVTGLTHPTCKCNEPKFFNTDPPLNDDGKSIHCEMNKFDDMMALLERENPDFAEVVAVDASLDLFGRAWCVAELAEAHRMGMAQSLKMRNEETLLRRQLTLQGLKVENMKASRPEDVVEILAKIPDKEAFNSRLQELIFDSNVGLLAAWKNADALQQMEEVSHLLKWLRLSEAVEGGQIVWQRWLP